MKAKHLIKIIFFIIFVACSCTQRIHAITAKEILENVDKKYASLSSYRDSGSVKKDRGFVNFETYFTSPDSFLFKWEKVENLYFPDLKTSSVAMTKSAIRSNRKGTLIFFYYENNLNSEVEQFEDLKGAIVAATGISWTSSLYIPSLIFQGINKSKLTNLRETKIVGVQNIGEEECYIITGKWSHNDTEYKVWIEKDTYLIRKFIRDKSDIFSYDDVITNERIPSSVFEFQPD